MVNLDEEKQWRLDGRRKGDAIVPMLRIKVEGMDYLDQLKLEEYLRNNGIPFKLCNSEALNGAILQVDDASLEYAIRIIGPEHIKAIPLMQPFLNEIRADMSDLLQPEQSPVTFEERVAAEIKTDLQRVRAANALRPDDEKLSEEPMSKFRAQARIKQRLRESGEGKGQGGPGVS